MNDIPILTREEIEAIVIKRPLINPVNGGYYHIPPDDYFRDAERWDVSDDTIDAINLYIKELDVSDYILDGETINEAKIRLLEYMNRHLKCQFVLSEGRDGPIYFELTR